MIMVSTSGKRSASLEDVDRLYQLRAQQVVFYGPQKEKTLQFDIYGNVEDVEPKLILIIIYVPLHKDSVSFNTWNLIKIEEIKGERMQPQAHINTKK